jgi:2-polyprenyl-3-methyl-5-hydroxy-6-metoxy-1,4-benzoquinol methylase
MIETEPVRLYDATYRRFQLGARQRVRLDTYGHDLGQNSWLTIDEWRTALGWLGLAPGSRVLDVACGSGGPARWLARETGAEVVGVDSNRHAVARRWHDARARYRAELLEDEGEATFTGMQRFLATVRALAEQRRLSRYTFLARKEAPPC